MEPSTKDEALFAELTKPTLERCANIFNERGGQYGDTWRECQFLALKAVARELGITIIDDHCRAIALAALVDVKYIRLLGGYSDDSLIDGINYSAALAQEMMLAQGTL